MNTSTGTSGPAPIALRRDEGEALWFLDFLATIKSSADTTGGRVAPIEHLAGQDAGSPLHVHHREDEWFYVLDGELTIWVDGQIIPAPAGSFVYGPRNTPHTFTVSSPEGARFPPGHRTGRIRRLHARRRRASTSPHPATTPHRHQPGPRPGAAGCPRRRIRHRHTRAPRHPKLTARTSQPGKVCVGAPPGPTRARVTAATREHRLTAHYVACPT